MLQLADMPWAKVAIIGLIALAAYHFGMRNDGSFITANLETEKQQLDEVNRQLQVTRKAMENAERFESEIVAAKREFERVTDFMPPKLSVADLTTMISERSGKSGVRLLSTSPKSSQSESNSPKSPFYDSIRVTFKIEGTFAQILAFLSQTSRDPRMVMFDDTELATSAGASLDAPILTFGGDMVGYRYKKEAAPPAAAAAPGGANAKR